MRKFLKNGILTTHGNSMDAVDAEQGKRTWMVILIMGVSGSGKTTIGRLLARALQVPFVDGDDLHPRANIRKMKEGFPLTDDDRVPWLNRVAAEMLCLSQQGGGVVACSALKEKYRRILFSDVSFPVLLVYLKGTRDTLSQRLTQRTEHFMPPTLLDSQIKTLEEPDAALTLSIELSPEILCDRIVHQALLLAHTTS
jgi:carbohydrate kinase (thermoresistant glucokinase family)